MQTNILIVLSMRSNNYKNRITTYYTEFGNKSDKMNKIEKQSNPKVMNLL